MAATTTAPSQLGHALIRQNNRVPIVIPARLAATCGGSPDRSAWLARLPETIDTLRERWSLTLGRPFDTDDVSCAWVAPVTLPGMTAVIKLGMPHMEGDHEIDGLRFWNGNPTVRLLEADETVGAMLLERFVPGMPLRLLPEPEQDVIVARLLRRLWQTPSDPHPFRHLSSMLKLWGEETRAREADWREPSLVREGLQVMDDLARPGPRDVLVATDLHAGNVLQAAREPWLVIDPKPFVGDPAYDATQHLLNCRARVMAAPDATIGRFSDLAGVDGKRVRLWLFARAATSVEESGRPSLADLARRLGPP
jgi:streptomycin 6-kinase